MNVPAWLLPHTATIRRPIGESGHGVVYEPEPVRPVPCMVQDKRQLVRTSTGDEVVSQTAVFLPAGTDVPAESLVTAKGRTGLAVLVVDAEAAGLPTPDHVEIALI